MYIVSQIFMCAHGSSINVIRHAQLTWADVYKVSYRMQTELVKLLLRATLGNIFCLRYKEWMGPRRFIFIPMVLLD